MTKTSNYFWVKNQKSFVIHAVNFSVMKTLVKIMKTKKIKSSARFYKIACFQKPAAKIWKHACKTFAKTKTEFGTPTCWLKTISLFLVFDSTFPHFSWLFDFKKSKSQKRVRFMIRERKSLRRAIILLFFFKLKNCAYQYQISKLQGSSFKRFNGCFF